MSAYPFIRTPIDGLVTKTSEAQTETENDIVQLLLPWQEPGIKNDEAIKIKLEEGEEFSQKSIKIAELGRKAHVGFMKELFEELPQGLTPFDASRSFLSFWFTNSFAILNYPLNSQDFHRAIETVMSFQDPNGGFGGGPGQSAHVASTFACVTALAALLGSAEPSVVRSTWSRVNREKMYKWMMTLKKPDGSFTMQTNGEVDARGCYCVLAVATLLNFLTPDLAHRLPDFIAGCQTYEGGFGLGASFGRVAWGAPLGEAHGGYTSCALLAHFLLTSLGDSMPIVCLDYDSCWRWLTMMQALPVEGSGFRGRTNKLVDGCYSWWCGGLFPVIGQLIEEEKASYGVPTNRKVSEAISTSYDRRGLQEYVLLASQDQPPQDDEGGLRDKPSMGPDPYHTHYILSGLSSAQHFHQFSYSEFTRLEKRFKLGESLGPKGKNEDSEEASHRMRIIYARALAWVTREEKKSIVGLPENLIEPIHPIFNIHPNSVKVTMDFFYFQSDK